MKKIKRWRKLMALLLAAAVTAPMAPAEAYAAEEGNAAAEIFFNDEIVEEHVFEESGAADDGNNSNNSVSRPENPTVSEGDSQEHQHTWNYTKTAENTLTVSCANPVSGCSVSNQSIPISLKVDNVSGNDGVYVIRAMALSGNEEELLSDNELGIRYAVSYVSDNETDIPPQADGIYTARATFEFGQDAVVLEARYRIENGELKHQHVWKYKQNDKTTAEASCAGTVCECEAGPVKLVLYVKEKSAYVENPQEKRVAVSANDQNGSSISQGQLEEMGIDYTEEFYKDGVLIPGDKTQEPKDVGNYSVKVNFKESDVTLEGDFTIEETVSASSYPVTIGNKNTYKYDAENVKGPSLPIKPQTVTYYYYKKNGKTPVKETKGTDKFDSKSLPAGSYEISAKYTLSDNQNYIYETGRTSFAVQKGDQAAKSKIKVNMKNFDIKGKKPSPQLNIKPKEKATVTYYYSKKNKNSGGTEWKSSKKWTAKEIKKATTYYMYAVIKATDNYGKYTTATKKFIVYPDHKWSGLPKKLTSKEQTKKVTCAYCGTKETVKLPSKNIKVSMGKSVSLKSKGCTYALDKSAKKYISLKVDKKKNTKITTKVKPDGYARMPSSVKVTVKAYGKTYKNAMTAKLVIPEPKVKIYPPTKVNGADVYQFKFNYNIPGADKVTAEIEKKQAQKIGNQQAMKNYFNRYFGHPRPDIPPFINLSSASLKKVNNQVTFMFTAHYGSKKSEVFTKTISVN